MTKAPDDEQLPDKPEKDQEGDSEIEKFLRSIPNGPEKKELFMSLQQFGPAPNPFLEKLAEKINDRHIDKVLELAAKEDEHVFEDSKLNKQYGFRYFCVAAILFVFLTVFLVKIDKELYLEVLKYLATFLGGFGGGYGFKSYMDSRKK